MDVIKTLDSVFTALSLEISTNDIVKYEESYSKLRESIQQEIWAEDEKKNNEIRIGRGGLPLDFEPKRNNRFVLIFPEFTNIPAWSVTMVRLPKIEMVTNGARRFSDLYVELLDLVGPSNSRIIYENLMEPRDYQMFFQQVDPVGNIVQLYTIDVACLKSFEISDFSSNNDDISNIKLDFCINNIVVT